MHVRTVTNDVAYAMTWIDLKKKMTTKYCPRNEIKKIEAELWNLKVKGTDVVAYNQRFQELAVNECRFVNFNTVVYFTMCCDLKMAPKRKATRNPESRPVTTTPRPVTTTPPPVTDPTTTTSVTSAQLQAMIDFLGGGGGVSLLYWQHGLRPGMAMIAIPREPELPMLLLVTNEVAYAMTWSDLKKKMTTKYCPRNEIKKVEAELWNLKVQGTDVVAYNQRFQELALLSDRMFPKRQTHCKRYVRWECPTDLTSVVASKPKTMQEAIEMRT
ncbi:reverse transcriptase domain-containing protein [Tanacetum coccineum]